MLRQAQQYKLVAEHNQLKAIRRNAGIPAVIKWETFIRKFFENKLFPPGAKRENTLKKGPPKQRLLWGPPFSVPDTRGLTLMKIKYAPNVHL